MIYDDLLEKKYLMTFCAYKKKISIFLTWVFLFLIIVLIPSCGDKGWFNYKGLEATHIEVFKSKRILIVYHNDKIIKKYPIDLGFDPRGPKRIEGDGKTPEGKYIINVHNPNSAFHLSLGVSYPNAKDTAYAKLLGKSPGGEIFIHGQPNTGRKKKGSDWTAGCIAVKNSHIRQLYSMIKNGTEIYINP